MGITAKLKFYDESFLRSGVEKYLSTKTICLEWQGVETRFTELKVVIVGVCCLELKLHMDFSTNYPHPTKCNNVTVVAGDKWLAKNIFACWAIDKNVQIEIQSSDGKERARKKFPTMADEGETKKKRVVVESLGWLTESSIMPKKHRAIEGVGASSILELKAQLYKSQEESKRERSSSSDHHHLEVHRAKKKITAHDPFSVKNSGVEARAAKDKLELKAINDGSASYAALEKKAELYDKLVRGEISDEEDQEKYSVDFFRKGLEQGELQQSQGHQTSTTEGQGEYDDSVLPNVRSVGLGWTSATVDRSEHKRFVMEVHEEAKLAREKASDVKMRRQEQATARREKLKQAYLKKQLEKLKASSKTEQT